MDAPERGALMLVRFIGISLLAVSLVDLALYWVVAAHNQTAVAIFPCILKSIPAFIGLFLLVKARAVAEWISNKLDQ